MEEVMNTQGIQVQKRGSGDGRYYAAVYPGGATENLVPPRESRLTEEGETAMMEAFACQLWEQHKRFKAINEQASQSGAESPVQV